jgi:hypothetical protein
MTSVPTAFLLNHVDQDPLVSAEDRAWFRRTLMAAHRTSRERPAPSPRVELPQPAMG